MSYSEKRTDWSDELRHVRQRLDDVARRRIELQSQMRSLEIQIAILRAREQELGRALAQSAVSELANRLSSEEST